MFTLEGSPASYEKLAMVSFHIMADTTILAAIKGMDLQWSGPQHCTIQLQKPAVSLHAKGTTFQPNCGDWTGPME